MFGKQKLHILFVALWIVPAHGEKLGDGCGHAVLGPSSGVLASRNYPGTYPNHTWCEWRLAVAPGNRLALAFGDLDVEGGGAEEGDCGSSYLQVVTTGGAGYAGEQGPGRLCGGLTPGLRRLQTDSERLVVRFRSGTHVSGRGFLLSYGAVGSHELLSCLDRGSHFSEPKYRKYCPAGCRDVPGDVSGDFSQGYRHTSVLCKAAVHAGVVQDDTGGWVSVETNKGLSHYPASRANGVQSRDGSLSESRFTFNSNECKHLSVLKPVAVSASSWWQPPGPSVPSPSNSTPGSPAPVQVTAGGDGRSALWVAEQGGGLQWLQLDLGEKKKVTAVVVSGSAGQETHFYVRTYRLEVKERGRWRSYTQRNSTEPQVLEGSQDGHPTRTDLWPPLVARYLRLLPLAVHRRTAMRVELLGCPPSLPHAENVSWLTEETPPVHARPPMTDEHVHSHAALVKLSIIIIPTVLSVVLLVTCICVFKMQHKKQMKTHSQDPETKTGCWRQMKQPFSRQLSSEFTISYSSEKDPTHTLELVTSTVGEYQQPLMVGVGTVSRKGSTFRPVDTDEAGGVAAGNGPAHYDVLQTVPQYALPLPPQEPEYATPIVERHALHADFLPPEPLPAPPGGFRVPGGAAALGRSPSFGVPRGHPRTALLPPGEGVYDRPKAPQPQRPDAGRTGYQQPQAKPGVLVGQGLMLTPS